ncbi:hypothetical protein AB0H90_37480, partial [Streptomyces paromomycinus]
PPPTPVPKQPHRQLPRRNQTRTHDNAQTTSVDVLHRDRLALRIHDGAFSAMDLTARPPRAPASCCPP